MRHKIRVIIMMAIRAVEMKVKEAVATEVEVEGEEEGPLVTGNQRASCVIPKDTILMNVDLIPQQRKGNS